MKKISIALCFLLLRGIMIPLWGQENWIEE